MASNQQRQPTFDDPGVDDPRALSERQQWLGWLTNLIDGAMLGWGDEATAGILSMLDPNSPGYQSELDTFRRYQDRYNEQFPVRGSATNLAGNVLAGGALPKVPVNENFWGTVARGAGTNIAAGAAGVVGGAREGDQYDQGALKQAAKGGMNTLEVGPVIISGISPRFGGSVFAGGASRKMGRSPNRPNMVSSSVHGRHTPKGKQQSEKRRTYTDEELELMYNPQAYPLRKYGEKKKGK